MSFIQFVYKIDAPQPPSMMSTVNFCDDVESVSFIPKDSS